MRHVKAFLLIFCLLPAALEAETLTVAVAANIYTVLKPMMAQFKNDTGHDVVLISGASGKLYAQIIQGAPFDVFLSADTQKPLLLEQKGLGSSRFTYAQGKLVLATKFPNALELLAQPAIRTIALANPRFAPYGVAAEQVLSKYTQGNSLPRRILAENVAQVAQYLDTGAVDAGLMAGSLTLKKSDWFITDIPASDYSPIIQQAVFIKAHQSQSRYAASEQLKDFLLSAKVQGQLIGLGFSPIAGNDVVRH